MAELKSVHQKWIVANTTILLHNLIEALRNEQIEMVWSLFQLKAGYKRGPALELIVPDMVNQRRVFLPTNSHSIYVVLDSEGDNHFTGQVVWDYYVNGKKYSRITEKDNPLQNDVLFLRDVVYAKLKE